MKQALSHRLCHNLSHRRFHGPCGPNYAQKAVTAFSQFVRLHRRLMKLVPEVFDYGIEQHQLKRKQEEREFEQLFLPALEKVYGTTRANSAPSHSVGGCRNGAEKVQHPLGHLSPAKRRKVDALYEERNLWLKLGSQALRLMQTRQPHRLPGLSLIARMIDVAFTMQRQMCGLETNLKIDPHEHLYRRNWQDDLSRIFGSNVAPANVTEEEIAGTCLPLHHLDRGLKTISTTNPAGAR